MMVASPIPAQVEPRIRPGPGLLDGIGRGPGLAAHRQQYGEIAQVTLDELVDRVDLMRLRGRGGAAFPFAVKLRAAAAGRRPVVVVNASEGEPASHKDGALAVTRPHLVLDGALAAAGALGAREVHVIVPHERRHVAAALRAAVAERPERERITVHAAADRFVAGQARAVLELMAGRPNLPVTAWQPEAVEGHRGRPTLLSNAETWAHVGRLLLVGDAAYAEQGTAAEPGTTLLTLSGPVPVVVEEAFGTPLADVVPSEWMSRPVLVGGFHGAWMSGADVSRARVSVDGLRELDAPLGAGALVSPTGCPVVFTSRVVDYLAGQSAGRCGPCLHGMPALAGALRGVVDGTGGTARVEQLAALVEGRGACAHPDGTVRLVRSLLTALPDEVAAHGLGRCAWAASRGQEAP